MWGNRWVRVGAVALGFFVINGLARLISRLTEPEQDPFGTVLRENTSGIVIAVIGALLVLALMAVSAAYWAARHPSGEVFGELGAATLGGTLLATLVGPFIGGGTPFEDGLETFVLVFGQFLGLGALGIAIGFATITALGRDWKSRGLKEYSQRFGRHPRAATGGPRKR
jgi:hypothetical protein